MSSPVVCAHCGADAEKLCAGCKKVTYCGTACQKAQWAAHKDDCRREKKAREAAEAAAASPPPKEFSPSPGVDPMCAQCRVARVTKVCDSCRLVGYCGQACQLAAWAAHEPACTAKARERVLAGEGQLANSEWQIQTGLRNARHDFGDEHPTTLVRMGEYAQFLWGEGRFDEAEPQPGQRGRAARA